jgi:hypothetical protein
MSSWWAKFLIHGDALYNYMFNNIEFMLGDSYNKNFDIIDIRNRFGDIVKDIKNFYKIDIRNELLIWIKNELKEQRLLKKDLWKPFRDLECLTDMVFGYKYMFHYKHYYFQLCIEPYYFIDDNFINGIYNDNFGFFEIALYGWIDDKFDKLQPDNIVNIYSNNIMPKYYWELK